MRAIWACVNQSSHTMKSPTSLRSIGLRPFPERHSLTPASAKATMRITSDWGSGFQAEVEVTNDTGRELKDWRLEFTMAPQISSIWNGAVANRIGTKYVIRGESWNNTLAKGAKTSFGFVAQPGNFKTLPTDFVLKDATGFARINPNTDSDPSPTATPTPTPTATPTPTPSATPTPTPAAAPAKPTLAILKNWGAEGGYDLQWNKWSGPRWHHLACTRGWPEIHRAPANAGKDGQQTGTYHVGNREYGVYTYRVGLMNSAGETLSDPQTFAAGGAGGR